MGRKLVVVVLGGVLLVALVVTMVRISGPETGSLGKRGMQKRVSDLRAKTEEILKAANVRFSEGDAPVFTSSSLRFDGEVLRIYVGPAWGKMSRDRKAEALEYVAGQYVVAWQREMKSHREPAIVIHEGAERVGLHTRIEHWVR